MKDGMIRKKNALAFKDYFLVENMKSFFQKKGKGKEDNLRVRFCVLGVGC